MKKTAKFLSTLFFVIAICTVTSCDENDGTITPTDPSLNGDWYTGGDSGHRYIYLNINEQKLEWVSYWLDGKNFDNGDYEIENDSLLTLTSKLNDKQYPLTITGLNDKELTIRVSDEDYNKDKDDNEDPDSVYVTFYRVR